VRRVGAWSGGAWDEAGAPSVPASTPAGTGDGADGGDNARLTIRQREIARSLSERDPELARWFTSAAALAREQRPAAWPELLAHLGRDLMNRMPEYFDVPRPPRIEYPNLIGRLVSALGKEADLDNELVVAGGALAALRELVNAQRSNTARPGPDVLFAAAGRADSRLAIHRAALETAWRQTQRGFVSSAHMRSVGKSPVAPSVVLAHFARLEDLLAAQVGGLSFWSLEAELREIAALEAPTRSDLDRALLLARGEAVNTFLASLESPAWLAPMRAAQLFESPPASEVRLDGGYRTPFWEPSRYLVRIAAEAPEEVTEALLSLPETDNSRVHRDVIEAALAMPAEYAMRVASVVPSLLREQYPIFAAEQAALLAAKLIGEGQPQAGLDLARFLFTTEVFVAGDWGLSVDVGFRHLFDSDYEYAEAVAAVRAAVGDHAPLDGLRIFLAVLARTLEAEQGVRGREGPEQLSYIWRKAIDDHAQNVHEGEVRDALIVAIRDLVTSTINGDPTRGPEVLAVLDSSDHLVFRRLALHVIRVCEFPGVVEQRAGAMLDREAFDDPRIHREMFLLQRERFGGLSAGEQAQIISWIENGPEDHRAWREGFERFEGRAANDKDWAMHVAGWQQGHWLGLEPWLTTEQRGSLDTLTAAHGADPHPEFNTFVTAGFAPIEVPYESDDLRAMTTSQLLELFTSRQPSGERLASRPDALAMAVEQAVRDAPEHWAAQAAALATAPPRYRQALFSGFAVAAATGHTFDVAGVIDLAAAHLADGPPQVADDEPRRDGRRSIADLLRWLLTEAAGCRGDVDGRIWRLIEQLVDDPGTDVGDTSDGARGWTPRERQLPLETVRSLAYQAAIAFGAALARWGEGDRVVRVREVIAAGLAADREPSLAVRAALAAKLPELVALDADWAGRLIAPMLTDAPDDLAEAAWSAVLDLRPIPLDVVRLLLAADAYDWALEHICAETRFSTERRERLGRQLLGAAVFDIAGYGEPWARWHEREDGEIRARVVDSIGNELRTRGEAPAGPVALASRWRERLEALTDGDPEFAGYGSWFGAAAIDADVAAELLCETLRRSGGAVASLRSVLEAAILAAATVPGPVIEAVRLIADGPTAGQLGWRDGLLRELIALLAADQDPEIAQRLNQLIDGLAERGLGDFRVAEPT
jgi:hypothetical protein